MDILSQARAYKREFWGLLKGSTLAKANVIGAGCSDESLLVYVKSKEPIDSLSIADSIVSKVNGLPTQVVEVGNVSALPFLKLIPPHSASFIEALDEKWEKKCGTSCGHFKITAGTLGCLVRKKGDAKSKYILSNNHVLAMVNDATVGDAIYLPGPYDGGKESDRIANLSAYRHIDMSGDSNEIDAAIAKLIDPNSVNSNVIKIGKINPTPKSVSMNQEVQKHGRTTKHTQGKVTGVAVDIQVNMGKGIALFVDQIAVQTKDGHFSQGGDSGSLVMDMNKHPVGLLFAGGGNTTFMNPIQPVLKQFELEVI